MKTGKKHGIETSTPESETSRPNLLFCNISSIRKPDFSSSTDSSKIIVKPKQGSTQKSHLNKSIYGKLPPEKKATIVIQSVKRQYPEGNHEEACLSSDDSTLQFPRKKAKKISTDVDESADQQTKKSHGPPNASEKIDTIRHEVSTIGLTRRGIVRGDFIDAVRREKVPSPEGINGRRLSVLPIVQSPVGKSVAVSNPPNASPPPNSVVLKSAFDSPFDGTVLKGRRNYKIPGFIQKKSIEPSNKFHKHLYASCSIENQMKEDILWSRIARKPFRGIIFSPSTKSEKTITKKTPPIELKKRVKKNVYLGPSCRNLGFLARFGLYRTPNERSKDQNFKT